MKAEKLSLEDGALMRTLVDFPGGLELHIGVRGGGRNTGEGTRPSTRNADTGEREGQDGGEVGLGTV